MNPNPLLALNHFTVPCSLNCVSLFFLSYLCYFSTASSHKKRPQVWNLQPLQIPKVLQEQQTQGNTAIFPPRCPLDSSLNSSLRVPADIGRCTLTFPSFCCPRAECPFPRNLAHFQRLELQSAGKHASGVWVRLVIHGHELADGRLRVPLGRGKRNVPEQILNRPQVCAIG